MTGFPKINWSFFIREFRVVAALLTGIFLVSPAVFAERKIKPEIAVTLSHGGGGMTITPKGSYIISIHQYYQVLDRVIEVTQKGEVKPFPTEAITRGAPSAPVMLDAVQGLECGNDQIVWMLDNGRRSEVLPKIVAWNIKEKALHKVIYLPMPATTESSYVTDLVLDPQEPFLYIADPAAGQDAALIVVDRRTGVARRVLQGHYSVVPEDNGPLFIEGAPFSARLADGSSVEPQAGVNPIGIDKKGRWLYYGPLKGKTLYRISTEHLRDSSLSPVELGSRVEGYAEKPICDGISIDSKGNIYAGDLVNNAIQVIESKERKLRFYTRAPGFLWPDGLCFGVDGRLHFYTSQLHRSAVMNGGDDTTKPPFKVYRIKALSGGSVGR